MVEQLIRNERVAGSSPVSSLVKKAIVNITFATAFFAKYVFWGGFVFVGICTLYFTAEWVSSLKEKRMVVKHIVEKAGHKFNISIAEIDKQDVHKSIVIGFACVSNQTLHVEKMMNNVIDFIENNTDAVLDRVETEIV